MEREQFTSERTGHVIRVNSGDAAYWAFRPKPLPFQVHLDVHLVNSLSQADHALGELAGLGRIIADPYLLIRPFVRREAVQSSQIEGTRAGLHDLYAYEAAQLALPGVGAVPDYEPDVREVSNYVRALEYGLQLIQDMPVGLWLIRELHTVLLEGVRGETKSPGEFRKEQAWIGGSSSSPKYGRFVPPPVELLDEALSAFERYLRMDDDLPPLIRLALIHYQFETIHPFRDGNGRIGRLLISLLLVGWDLLPSPLLYLSDFFNRHRQAYYDLLFDVSARGAVEEWILFFLQGVTEQARDAITRAKRLLDLQQTWRERVLAESSSTLLTRIIDQLFRLPYISTRAVQTFCDVSAPTASKAIHQLESLGFLQEVTGRRRDRLYVAGPILDITQGDNLPQEQRY